jgi:hypothetical protein
LFVCLFSCLFSDENMKLWQLKEPSTYKEREPRPVFLLSLCFVLFLSPLLLTIVFVSGV